MTDKKMVPESDLLAVKAMMKKVQTEIVTLKADNSRLLAEAEVLGIDDGDEGQITAVKKALLKQAKDLKAKEDEFNKKQLDFSGREKSVRIKELVTQYKLSEEAASKLEEMPLEEAEKEAYRLRVEKLETLVKEGKKEEGEFFERGSPAVPKMQPKDMPDKDFTEYVEKQKEQASQRVAVVV